MVSKLFLALVALFAAGLPILPVAAQTPLAAQVGRPPLLPFSEIKARADRAVGGRLIGTDYDPDSLIYQMRYMRGSEVVDVVVDARTGQILGRRGSR